jgi:tetratricopeptide (TPR) repeat protein
MAPSSGPRIVLACTLLALLAWSGSIVRGGFSFDDREVIDGNPVVAGSVVWTEAFRRDYWAHRGDAGHFRPTAALSLRLDRWLYGAESALGWHVTNVLLHAACVLLLGLALLLLGPTPERAPLPWFGLATFAVHPALADSVAWVSGRTSMLTALPGLAAACALLAASVPWRPLSPGRTAGVVVMAALGVLGALLGKEDGAVFALVFVLLGARHSRGMLAACAGGSALGLAVWLALRAQALGSPWPAALHAPLAGAPAGTRLAVGGRALTEALRLAAAPLGYPPSYERLPAFQPAGVDLRLAALGWLAWSALVIGGLVGLARDRRSTLAASALVVAAAVLPWTQLVPAGALFAPRFLYLPLLLAAPLIHAAWARLARAPRTAAAGLLIAAGVVGAWQRASVYATRGSFHATVLEHHADDPTAWNELGLYHEELGELEEARRCWELAAGMDPDYGRPWSNLGRLALAEGDLAGAEDAFRAAVERGPANPVARCNLGSLLLRRALPDEAARAYTAATRLAPGMLEAWRGLARAQLEAGHPDRARTAVREALAIDPADRRARELEARIGD